MLKVICVSTDINVEKLAKKILNNEPRIIKKYPGNILKGNSGLSVNSLTSRSPYFNVLNWWGTGSLRKWIRSGYEEYNGIKDKRLYVQCWSNVMRKGEQIGSHKHEMNGMIGTSTKNILSGNFGVQVDGTTSTYYDGNPILNVNGVMSFFPASAFHWTDRYEGNSERITISFDILSEKFYNDEIYSEYKYHWVKL